VLSIQYVYERFFFFIPLVSQSGCKSTTLFLSRKLYLKKNNLFFITLKLTQSINELVPLFPISWDGKGKSFFYFWQTFFSKNSSLLQLFLPLNIL